MAAGGPVLEAPALVELAIGLVWLLAWVVAAGLLWSYRSTLGYLLNKLADVLVFPGVFGHGRVDFGGPIRSLNREILHLLGAAASGAEAGMGRAFHAAARLAEWGADELLLLAEETYHFGDWLLHVHLPTWAATIRHALVTYAELPYLVARELARLGVGATRTIEHTVTHTVTVVQRVAVRPIEQRLARLEHRVAAIAVGAADAVTAPGAITIANPVERIGARLRELEKLLAAGGVAALGITVLARLGFGWVRCSNVGKAGRAICGMNPSLLESLLADGLAIAGLLSIVELTEGLLEVQDELAGGILLGFRETRDLVAG